MAREEVIAILEQPSKAELIPMKKTGSSFKMPKKEPETCWSESRQVTNQPFKKLMIS